MVEAQFINQNTEDAVIEKKKFCYQIYLHVALW